MVRLVLSLAVFSSSACTRRQQDFAWFAVNVAATVARASAEASAVERRPAVAVAAPDPAVAPGPPPAQLAHARRVALELTVIAGEDARAGNCDAVARTGDQVRSFDADVFATAFLRDPAIAECLASARP